MAKSISEINKRLRELNKKYKKSGLTDGKISHKAAMASLKGDERLKMSDEAKKAISKRMKGKPKTKSHKQSLKQSKLKFKITKKQILEAQKDTKTAKEVADKFGIDIHTYKAIAEYHGVYKKLSLAERNKQNCSLPVLVYYYNTMEFIAEYPSIAEAQRNLKLKGASNIVSVCKGKYKQYNGYYFEYKK